ncbi:MAG: hypothetical protein V4667_09825 [Bacteroidota bacterium]
MIPVHFHDTDEGINFTDFHDKLIEICTEHQKTGRASAFALIIYDFHNPHMERILRDSIYWKSLHNISGQYLTVFSIFDNSFKNEVEEKLKPTLGPKKMTFSATAIKTDQNHHLGYVQLLEKFFNGLEFKSPSILFFQVNQSKISNHFLIHLKEDKFEEGFNEIKKIIKTGADSVSGIFPQNKSNYDEIFELIQKDVDSAIFWLKVKKKVPIIVEIANFAGLFKT